MSEVCLFANDSTFFSSLNAMFIATENYPTLTSTHELEFSIYIFEGSTSMEDVLPHLLGGLPLFVVFIDHV